MLKKFMAKMQKRWDARASERMQPMLVMDREENRKENKSNEVLEEKENIQATLKPLNPIFLENCDQCAHAPAKVKVQMNNSVLYFCGHHWRKNSEKLVQIVDVKVEFAEIANEEN